MPKLTIFIYVWQTRHSCKNNKEVPGRSWKFMPACFDAVKLHSPIHMSSFYYEPATGKPFYVFFYVFPIFLPSWMEEGVRERESKKDLENTFYVKYRQQSRRRRSYRLQSPFEQVSIMLLRLMFSALSRRVHDYKLNAWNFMTFSTS